MRFKRPIYRYAYFAMWIAILAGIVTLVVAANGRSKARTCKGVAVSINAEGDKLFIEKDDVMKSIHKTAKGTVVAKPFAAINLGTLEKALEKNPWIRDAELYFDTRDVLHVAVWERQPIARVFNTAGASFYIDSSGHHLPLLDGVSVRLPVVTGFTAAKKMRRRDSLTLQGLKEVIRSLSADPFWTAQVGQIDIAPDGKFELIPVVGNHSIKLGYAENVSEKLANLLVFYRQVLPRAGFAKYSALDLQFEGQVVAVRRGPTSVVDSLQLQKNIEELIKRKAAEQEPEDVVAATPSDSAAFANRSAQLPVPATTASLENSATAKRALVKSNSTVKPQTSPAKTGETKRPKALMPKKGT